MGCVLSSKIMAKSGSFQEKISCTMGHSFQRSSAMEEITLSTSKTTNGDQQFLALLRRTSSSSATPTKSKEPEAAAAVEPAAKIETIDVSELLAGLEEEEGCAADEQAKERRRSSRDGGSPAPLSSASDGRARSFRTVEELDAMLLTQMQSQSGSSSERAMVAEQEELVTTVTAAAAEAEVTGGSSEVSGAGGKRRARARQLGDLKVPGTAAAAFDFSKSGSLRDWLRHGGQSFSPGSYVTPRFGASPLPPAELGGVAAGDHQQQQQGLVFDPELVAQFERAMEQLSEDEGRVLDEILDALEKKDGAAEAVVGDGQPADVAAAAALVQQVV